YPLSSVQRRIYFLQQLDREGTGYNIPFLLNMGEYADREKLEYTCKQMIQRHEILRTVFRENEENDVRQYVIENSQFIFNIPVNDLSAVEDPANVLDAELAKRFPEPFDLSGGPLLKACLFRLDIQHHVLFCSMHHIICDGWSIEVFTRELSITYNALLHGSKPVLNPLPVQYSDYAEWQQEQLTDPHYEEHRNYWLNRFSGELPLLEFP
ncbi:MAG: hypothetical protein GY940_08510, partial [bacterium]|nr:hypothetical protein [bacterium]